MGEEKKTIMFWFGVFVQKRTMYGIQERVKYMFSEQPIEILVNAASILSVCNIREVNAPTWAKQENSTPQCTTRPQHAIQKTKYITLPPPSCWVKQLNYQVYVGQCHFRVINSIKNFHSLVPLSIFWQGTQCWKVYMFLLNVQCLTSKNFWFSPSTTKLYQVKVKASNTKKNKVLKDC